MMEKDKDQLQRALGDREKEISSLLRWEKKDCLFVADFDTIRVECHFVDGLMDNFTYSLTTSSCKEHVQSSLNTVTGQYQELLSQLSRWRSVLESDDAVKVRSAIYTS